MQGRGISLQYIAEENNQLRLLEAELLGIQQGIKIGEDKVELLNTKLKIAEINFDNGKLVGRKSMLKEVLDDLLVLLACDDLTCNICRERLERMIASLSSSEGTTR